LIGRCYTIWKLKAVAFQTIIKEEIAGLAGAEFLGTTRVTNGPVYSRNREADYD